MNRWKTSALAVAALTALALGACDDDVGNGGAGGGTGSSKVSSSASRSTGALPTIAASNTTTTTTVSSTGALPTTGSGTAPECQAYCTTIQANCTVANAQYANTSECLTACGMMAPGVPGAQLGDTIACRQYHAEAAETMPVPHCAHAGPDGGGVCVD